MVSLRALQLTILFFSTALTSVDAFSATSPNNNFVSSFLDGLFGKGSSTTASTVDADDEKRKTLKLELIALCQDGTTKREKIEDVIAELRVLSPIQETATSPQLQKEWLLLWTTEKEINFFIDWNISGQISQTLENNEVLTNMIPFQKGGSFGVKGKLSIPSNDDDETENGLRTEFEFETATLDLGKWGTYSFPPIGKGWFDTVYLDEDFRIDLNSRDDILICQASFS